MTPGLVIWIRCVNRYKPRGMMQTAGDGPGVHGGLQDPAGNAAGVLQELVPQSCLAAILVLGTAPAGKDDRPHQGEGELLLLSAAKVFVDILDVFFAMCSVFSGDIFFQVFRTSYKGVSYVILGLM